MELFDDILDNASRPVKIFISSREYQDIADRFNQRANIRICASDNQDDIAKYVEEEVAKHNRWHKMSEELKKEFFSTLLGRSKGMFQWAALQVKQILELKYEGAIRDRLGKLPEGLKSAYDEIYAKIKTDPCQKAIAERVFQWVMCSAVPPTTKLLIEVVCQDPKGDEYMPPQSNVDEDLILDLCHNLLALDPNRNVWVFSHLSVIEYFEEHHWNQIQANCLVANVCFIALNHSDKEILHTVDSKYVDTDLRTYASLQAFGHLKLLENTSTDLGDDPIDGPLSSKVQNFFGSPFESSVAYRRWVRDICKNIYISGDVTGIADPNDLQPSWMSSFGICCSGVYSMLPEFWDEPWQCANKANDHRHTLLQLAARAASLPICERLIHWGADVNLQPGDESALICACVSQDIGIMRLLINSGANINAQVLEGPFQTALIAAASNGHLNHVELLLQRGADPHAVAKSGEFGSALAAAAESAVQGLEKMQLLLESSADANAQLQ
ncbi:hypothetical protein BDY21DRAFT_150021 [Lineolata rhizophorae]|uniref:Uncharacterized protein n=1 Tax=Lineolata rhizophorae TaxID=578093 RepID=A0A6A6NMB3_9PEZI|nr:hypothetical protein BDY21DRAFT_150021 [Lineolata rhizophorae]